MFRGILKSFVCFQRNQCHRSKLYQNQNVILGMSLLNGIGKSVMTGLCGGDAGDMTEAFLEGMIEGAAMGMLFCAAAAVLATSMLTVMMAHTAASSVVSIVLAIYSVSEGDYLNALVYGAVAVAGIIGVCRWWKVTCQVDYVGEKGIARFDGGKDTDALSSDNLKVINSMSKKKLQDNLPKSWTYTEHNGRVHIKDANGNFRVRIDPPDRVTNYQHMHIYDEFGNPLDIDGNVVGPKSASGHIPWDN